MDNNDGDGVEGWAELTRECLVNILSRISLEHRWTGPMLTCKRWLDACKDPSLHTVFDLDIRFDSSAESTRWWSLDFEKIVDSMLRSVVDWSDGGLREVRVMHCTDRSILYAAERCHNLEVLSIKSCPNVTDASMVKIALYCHKLRELDLSYCYEVSHKSLSIIGENCPNLKTFRRNLLNWLDPSQHNRVVPAAYLDALPQDGNSEAGAIGKHMPRLKHLELRFAKITSKGLVSICEGCLDLEYLDLFGCMNLRSRDIINTTSSLKNIKEIKKPNFYFPRSVYHTDRYDHWRLYDERFQTDIFRI